MILRNALNKSPAAVGASFAHSRSRFQERFPGKGENSMQKATKTKGMVSKSIDTHTEKERPDLSTGTPFSFHSAAAQYNYNSLLSE